MLLISFAQMCVYTKVVYTNKDRLGMMVVLTHVSVWMPAQDDSHVQTSKLYKHPWATYLKMKITFICIFQVSVLRYRYGSVFSNK